MPAHTDKKSKRHVRATPSAARRSGSQLGVAGRFQTEFQGVKGRNTLPLRTRRLWAHADVGLVERTYLLATPGRGYGRRLQTPIFRALARPPTLRKNALGKNALV